MNSNVTIAASPNVKGDITSCGIDQIITGLEKKHFYSISQTTQYSQINNCTKEVIVSYSVPELSWGFLPIAFFSVLLFYILTDFLKVMIRGYKSDDWRI